MPQNGTQSYASPVSIERRLGPSPAERGSGSDAGTCPDLFLLSSGDVAVIGTEAPEELRERLPADAGIAAHERLIVLPRAVLLAARDDIMKL